MNLKPALVAAASSSRATSAEAVVWSTKVAPFLHAGEGAVGADRDRAQIVVVADAAHHEILAFGGGLRGRGGLAAELVRPFLRLGGGRGCTRSPRGRLFRPGVLPWETHHAETEKSDFSHVCYLGVLPAKPGVEPDGVLEGAAP